MEKKKYSATSSTFKEKFSTSKSYLDLSNNSKVNYNKQKSINNTNEICEFFTSITNNQKDISKKYEQLFSLIKKFGKEIKYLLNKNDEHNNILSDTKECIKKIKAKLGDSSYSDFENIEIELLEDRNNIDVLGRIITYLLEEVGYYNKNSYECNKKIEDLKKYVGNKDDYTKLERKLTLKSEELKKEMVDNMSSLRENQDLKVKIKEDRNIYRKDIQNMHQKLLYVILKFLLRDKKYKTQKQCFVIWLNIIKNKKEARNKIVFCFCKKQNYLLSFCLRKLRSNCSEKYLIDKITSFIGMNTYGNKSNNENNNNNRNNNSINNMSATEHSYIIHDMQNDKKNSEFSNFVNSKKMKNSDLSSTNYDLVNNKLKKRSESTLFYEKNNSSIRRGDMLNMYDASEDSTSRKRDTTKYYNDGDTRNNGNNVYDKNVYDKNGYDKNVYDKNGYDKNEYDKNGYDKNEFDKNEYDKNEYDKNIYDKNEYDKNEYDKNLYDRNTYDRNTYDKNTYDKNMHGQNNAYDKSNSLYDYCGSREPNDNVEKVYDKFLHKMKEKADKKNVDILHQTLKKLNTKINDIRNTLEKQKKINEELCKNIPTKKVSSNYKNTADTKLSDTDYNNSIERNDSLSLFSEKTLSEYLMNRNTSRNVSRNNSLNKGNEIKKTREDFKRTNEYDNRKKKSDIISQKKSSNNNDEKWNLSNNKYSKYNSMDTFSVDSNYLYLKDIKNKVPNNKYIKKNDSNESRYVPNETTAANSSITSNTANSFKPVNTANAANATRNGSNRRKDFIENSNDSSSPSDIKLVLRTGGGFRKLSEHDQKNYMEKLNYLNDNNLLGYETNLNIKIKGHPFIHNIPNNNRNVHKKEKRHRSLSKFYNMH
ncbi:conserved Plasmodium protein, unknown function [Plasmodium malariae]|uniref:Uncharacterized protein n=1 Tax=Plasmodium malariae TaxID=5858 RepID=A0A1D3SQ44_PLAMA|nr:conserved Plasmodium protein, unknown function [Plasmodium malariae]SCO94008.1 conserved Plasmodium protein, unknown function [Plasmodium malariae]